MKERPIVFTGESVRAILEGKKTQTRRVIKPQPISAEDAMQHKCPYRIGGRLWVKETWQALYFLLDPENGFVDDWEEADLETARKRMELGDEYHYGITYRADTSWDYIVEGRGFRWRPPRYMPKWASRITLEITNVRVERLQDISEEDARAEGVEPVMMDTEAYHPWDWPVQDVPYYLPSFVNTWDRINARRGYGWDTNPWVFVIEFQMKNRGADGQGIG